jgi:teichuronic acid biosynthesis glycosyltransferase TuaC
VIDMTDSKTNPRKLRVLSMATMFPNPRMPVHAQFVKQRLDALSRKVDLVVVSPIPWFPGEKALQRYRNRSAIPASDPQSPYPVFYPRFFSIPGLIKPLEGLTLAFCLWRFIRSRYAAQPFDLLDCHLGFPDGFAGALVARVLGLPHTVTLRGHDINELYRYPVRIRQVIYGLKHSARFFGVAQALVDAAVALGAPANKGFRSANGVNPSRFFPAPREDARVRLGLAPGRYLLSVSHLVPRKGVDIVMRAFAQLKREAFPDLRFIIVGKGGEEGDSEPQLRHLAEELQVADSIVWAGAVLNTDLRWWYSAADVFCLASEKEGWPNVVLEALACGTPVVAAATWGIPEIITSDTVGLLVKERNPQAFAMRISEALRKTWEPDRIAEFAASNTWDQVAENLVGHFNALLSSTSRPSRP